MTQLTDNKPALTGNMLKLLAAVTMTIDHIGVILFPTVMVLRVIGRMAMPIFAYMIAEGCYYTRSKLRYFLLVLALGVVCQTVYVVVANDWYLCMPISFALSILTVSALDAAIKKRSLLWAAAAALCVGGVWVLTQRVQLDYGFWGCMLPVCSYLPRLLPKADRRAPVLGLTVGLCLLSMASGVWQWWSLLAVPPLLLYSGKRGKWKMKYFFYIFYPAHLAILQGVAWLLK